MVAEGVRTTGAALALGARHRHRAADRRADGRRARWATHAARGGRGADGAAAASRSKLDAFSVQGSGSRRHGFFRQDQAVAHADEGAVRRAVRGSRSSGPTRRTRAARPVDVETDRSARRSADLGRRRRRGDRADRRGGPQPKRTRGESLRELVQARDPVASCAAADTPRAERPPPARRDDRRRQRHRQDDDGRQARAADQGFGPDAADLRRRHLPRRRRRAARGLGEARRRRHHPGADRRRSRRGRVRRDRRGQGAQAATS